MTQDVIDIKLVDGGNGTRIIKRGFDDIAKAALTADTAIQQVRKSLASLSGNQFAALNTGISSLNNQLNKNVSATNTAAKGVKTYTASVTGAVREVSSFRNGLYALSGALGVSALLRFADAGVQVDNNLRTISKTTEDFTRNQQFLRQVTRDTRTDLETNSNVYARLTRSTEGLGISTEKLEKIQKTLALSTKVGGASTREANAALIQLSQALAAGSLRGEELNSITEQLPVIASAIGKEFGVAGGALRAFANNNPNILTTDRVLKGILAFAPEIERQFALMTPTFGDAFNVLKLGAIEAISQLNGTTGAITGLINSIVFIGDNLTTILPLVALFGVAWGVNAVAAMLRASATSGVLSAALTVLRTSTTTAAAATGLLNLALGATPVGRIVALLTLLASTFIVLYQNSETFRNVLAFLGNVLISIANSVISFLTPAFNALYEAFLLLTPTGQALGEIFASIVAFVTPLVAAFQIAYTTIATALTPAWNELSTAIQPLLTYLPSLSEFLGVLVRAVILPAVVIIASFVQVMASLGVVTQEASNKVAQAAFEALGWTDAINNNDASSKKLISTITTLNPLIGKKTALVSQDAVASNNAAEANRNLMRSWLESSNGANTASNSARNYGSSLGNVRSMTDGLATSSRGAAGEVGNLSAAMAEGAETAGRYAAELGGAAAASVDLARNSYGGSVTGAGGSRGSIGNGGGWQSQSIAQQLGYSSRKGLTVTITSASNRELLKNVPGSENIRGSRFNASGFKDIISGKTFLTLGNAAEYLAKKENDRIKLLNQQNLAEIQRKKLLAANDLAAKTFQANIDKMSTAASNFTNVANDNSVNARTLFDAVTREYDRLNLARQNASGVYSTDGFRPAADAYDRLTTTNSDGEAVLTGNSGSGVTVGNIVINGVTDIESFRKNKAEIDKTIVNAVKRATNSGVM